MPTGYELGFQADAGRVELTDFIGSPSRNRTNDQCINRPNLGRDGSFFPVGGTIWGTSGLLKKIFRLINQLGYPLADTLSDVLNRLKPSVDPMRPYC
jgi:hypothetical protein